MMHFSQCLNIQNPTTWISSLPGQQKQLENCQKALELGVATAPNRPTGRNQAKKKKKDTTYSEHFQVQNCQVLQMQK